MATATGNYVHDNSSLANFQNWTTPIYDAFVTTCGWVQTADSGQAANPIAAVPSSAYAYWIFKANDAAASTLPIYVKVEMGYNSTTVRIRMTAGTGSDGSGNITGGVSSAPWTITSLETNDGATTYTCYFSGDAGAFRMFMWQSAAINNGVLFGLVRSTDSAGAKTTDFYSAMHANANNNNMPTYQAISLAGNGPICGPGARSWPAGASVLTSANYSGTTAAQPVFPLVPPGAQLGNVMLDFVGLKSPDTADGASVTVSSMYGGTHTYIAAKTTMFSSYVLCTGDTSCPAMRYE